MGFSRQEYWNGFPFPTPGDLPDPGTEPSSLASPALQVDHLPLCHLAIRCDLWLTSHQERWVKMMIATSSGKTKRWAVSPLCCVLTPLSPWKKSRGKPRQHIKKQRHHFAHKGLYSQSYGFSSSHVWMWELEHKECWAPKSWHFQTVVLEKTLESPLDCKEITPVNPKGNQPWIFIGRTDAEAEALILWPSDAKSWLIGKDPGAGKDWRQKEKGEAEDELVREHHRLNGHEFKQTSGDSGGQKSLIGYSP